MRETGWRWEDYRTEIGLVSLRVSTKSTLATFRRHNGREIYRGHRSLPVQRCVVYVENFDVIRLPWYRATDATLQPTKFR